VAPARSAASGGHREAGGAGGPARSGRRATAGRSPAKMAPSNRGSPMAGVPLTTHLFLLAVPALIALGAIGWYLKGAKP